MRYNNKRGAQVIEEWPKRLPFNKVDVLLIVVMAICLIVPLVRLIMTYGSLPEIIPTHFGASVAQPDRAAVERHHGDNP